MLRVVGAFKIGWKSGNDHPSTKRFTTKAKAEDEITERSIMDHVPSHHYRVVPCFLLEVQTDRGEPLRFDLGNPIEIAG